MTSSEDNTTPQDHAAPPPAARPRLQRPKGERVIGGVCSGIARHLGVDPLIIRLSLVALALFGGTGIAVYLVAWLLMPSEGAPARDTPATVRIVLIVLAVVTAAGLLFCGGFWAAGAGGGVVVAISLITAGIVLATGVVAKAARWLLVPALALALGAGTAFAFDVELDGGVGERSFDPLRVQEIHSEYEIGMGELDIDLSRVEFPTRDTTTRVHIGLGEATVTVPPGVCVAVRGHVGAGEIDMFGDIDDGIDLGVRDEPSAPGTPRLVIDADIGMGELNVRRVDDPHGTRSPSGSAIAAVCEEARDSAR